MNGWIAPFWLSSHSTLPNSPLEINYESNNLIEVKYLIKQAVLDKLSPYTKLILVMIRIKKILVNTLSSEKIKGPLNTSE